MSLESAINTPEGEYIKGGFEGTISDTSSIPTKTGKTMFKAKIRDGQHEADLACFHKTFENANGKRLSFSGMGLKRGTNFNGRAQITLFDKSIWKLASSSPQATQPTQAPVSVEAHSEATQAYPIPPRPHTSGAAEDAKPGNARAMTKQWAALAGMTAAEFVKAGFSPEEARGAALKAPEWAAVWWFGEKGVSGLVAAPMAAPQPAPAYVPAHARPLPCEEPESNVIDEDCPF